MSTVPSSASRSIRRVLGAIVIVGVAGGCAFGVTRVATAPRAGELAPPAPGSVVGPSASPDYTAVARHALASTVTVEVLTTGAEQLGTGWLFDGQGDFVTNDHVIAGHLAIRLRDRNGGTHVATVVGEDAVRDIALLRSVDGFAGTPLVPSAAVAQTAEAVVAVASSRATGHGDITLERIDAVGVSVTAATDDVAPGNGSLSYPGMISVSGAAIFQGNSGGPLLDADGHVLGIITLASRSRPQAYAIPLGAVIDRLRGFAAH